MYNDSAVDNGNNHKDDNVNINDKNDYKDKNSYHAGTTTSVTKI